MLDKADVSNVSANAETWEKVIGKLRAEAAAGGKSVSSPIRTVWSRPWKGPSTAAKPNPGRFTLKKLTESTTAKNVAREEAP